MHVSSVDLLFFPKNPFMLMELDQICVLTVCKGWQMTKVVISGLIVNFLIIQQIFFKLQQSSLDPDQHAP